MCGEEAEGLSVYELEQPRAGSVIVLIWAVMVWSPPLLAVCVCVCAVLTSVGGWSAIVPWVHGRGLPEEAHTGYAY